MKKLNNKGFTLVEVIGVVVIISILAVILVPSISSLMNKGKNDTYGMLEDSIRSAARNYVGDKRYELNADEGTVTIKVLIDEDYLSPSGTTSTGVEYIVDPRDKNKRLNLTSSYASFKFDEKKREYVVNDILILVWN